MKIYTKRGDSGETDLFGGARISKSSPQVRAYGAVDAANAAIGFVLASPELDPGMAASLTEIMHRLFDLGAELSTKDDEGAHQKRRDRMGEGITFTNIQILENWIDQADAQLDPLKEFVLPTGGEAACRLHLAKIAVRHAEVEVIGVGVDLRPELIQYLNRLSDLLFTFARLANHQSGAKEVPWKKG